MKKLLIITTVLFCLSCSKSKQEIIQEPIELNLEITKSDSSKIILKIK